MRIPTPILRIVVNLTRLQSDRRRRPREVVCVEPLESRALLASFTVAPNAIFADGQEGSLRAAIMIANTNGEDDLITLQPGKYFLNLTQRRDPANDPENEGLTGDLDFIESGKRLIIQGTFSETGERPEIIGLSVGPFAGGLNEGVQDRLMHVHSGVTVVLRDITLRGGLAKDDGFDKTPELALGSDSFGRRSHSASGWRGGEPGGASRKLRIRRAFSQVQRGRGGGGAWQPDDRRLCDQRQLSEDV